MSREPRIDDYIARAQPFARPILTAVRDQVHAVLPEAEEAMKWSAPAFLLDGKILLVMAAFKAHAAVNFWRGKELGFETQGEGMGQLGKLTSVEDLPPAEEFERLLRSAAHLSATAPLTAKPKADPQAMPELHPDFAAALADSPPARQTFDAFAPGHKREYLQWIAEAKRDDTRAKRVAQAIEWLAEGKKRNWKYENC